MIRVVLFVFVVMVIVAGCGYNAPTPVSQIVGSYVSPIEYEGKSLEQLAALYNSLAQREDQLLIAQTQRIKTSRMQSYWRGYGTGDGMEAAELASVRGRKKAIEEAIALKNAEKLNE